MKVFTCSEIISFLKSNFVSNPIEVLNSMFKFKHGYININGKPINFEIRNSVEVLVEI